MPKNSITSEQKLEAVYEYLDGSTSFKKVGTKYGVDESSIRKWLAKYKAYGDSAFELKCSNINYTAEFKRKVAEAYISGEGSLRDIAIKFKIHADSTVLTWVSQYNNHEELTDSRSEGVFSMVKGKERKTTHEERIDIVKYCIEHQNNYAETALKFQVSYQQVYSWYQKYRKDGVEALLDKRGCTKLISEMTEFEKIKAENKLLKAENNLIQMENDFLKKLEEIERRGY